MRFPSFVLGVRGLILVGCLSLAAPGAEAQVGGPPIAPMGGEGGGGSSGSTVTPHGGTLMAVPGSSGNAATFFVTNTGTSTATLYLTCSATGDVTCTGAPASVTLDAEEMTDVEVTYGYASTGGAGSIRLATTHDQGSYTVSAHPTPTLTLVVPRETSAGRAVVRNRQPILRATYTPGGASPSAGIDSTSLRVVWGPDTVTARARSNRGLMEWEVDSAHALSPGDSVLASVRICSMSASCATSSRWVVLPADEAPILSFRSMAPGRPALEAGGVPGPGLQISGSEVESGLATVPFFTRGEGRSLGLVYSTRTSYPRVLVPVDIELPWPVGTPTSLTLILREGVVIRDSLTMPSPTCTTGASRRCRSVLQADYAGGSFPTPVRKWLTVEAQVVSGGVMRSSTDSVEVVIVDRRASPYGSGWWPTAGTRFVQAGNDRLLVSPTGAVAIFRGIGDSLYLPPAGEFTVVRRVATGWALSPRGALATTNFDALGRLVSIRDPHGNRDSVLYAGADDRIQAVRDPTDRVIALGYDPGNGNRLRTLTSQSGTAAARETRIEITAANLLVYDSLSSPSTRPATSRYTYQAYGSPSTVLMTRHIGVLADTTAVVYDSAFTRRPAQLHLPSVPNEVGTLVTPTITYLASRRQGYHAVRSLDSVYVEVRNPLGRYARSLPSRWGGSRVTWDSVGVLSRSGFDEMGFVRWSEGVVADSSRSWTDYDAWHRPVRSRIIRAAGDTLRADSLAYDANHRVIASVDARGQVTRYTYDALGSLRVVKGPTGDSSITWFRSDGLVDSVRAAGATKVVRYTYSASWKQPTQVHDETGTLLATTRYDLHGRADTVNSRRAVQAETGAPPLWAQRRTVTEYDVLNRTLAVQEERSQLSSDSSMSHWSPPDSQHIRRVAYVKDRAGRDSLRIDEVGVAARYLYDRLGRLRVRQPWIDSSQVVDSLFYDVAGNLARTRSRRGHVFTSAFDQRGRDTLTVVPGVGNLRRRYAGPAGQLTRMWYEGPVDSIGSVTGSRAWVYNLRGHAIADTSWAGGSGGRTSYAFDRYDRDSAWTDPLGPWSVAYEPARGLVTRVRTPGGDSLNYTYDARALLTDLVVWGNGWQSQAFTYGENGALTAVEMQAWTSAVFTNATMGQRVTYDDGRAWLTPIRTERRSPTWPVDSLWEDVTYDGWGRVTSWQAFTNGAPVATREFSFDRRGNVLTPGGGEVYDAVTGRLVQQVREGRRWHYVYDRSGNLVSSVDTTGGGAVTSWTYGYDALDQLVSARRNGTLIARYGYDVAGQRIAKRVYSASSGGIVGFTRFLYQGNEIMAEADSAGTILRRYLRGLGTDQLVAVLEGGDRYVTTLDRLGSVRSITKSGPGFTNWQRGRRYGPYGEVVSEAGSGLDVRFGWTGREYDAETGFYFHRARYYDPAQRRFVQADPSGYAGGRNLYAYVDGAVLDRRDPTGFGPEEPAMGPGMAAVCRYAGCGVGPQIYIDGVLVPNGLALLPPNSIHAGARSWTNPAFRGRITFDGPEADRQACFADKVCNHYYHLVDQGFAGVILRFDPRGAYTHGAWAGLGSYELYIIRYNPKLFVRDALVHAYLQEDETRPYLNPLPFDIPTVWSHEFGHVLWDANLWHSEGKRAVGCESEQAATYVENLVRAQNRSSYGRRKNIGC